MYGSSRRKHTCLVHNIPQLVNLQALCDGDHAREPWGLASAGWATAEETAYPWPLCRRIAALVALQAQDMGVVCFAPSFAFHTPHSWTRFGTKPFLSLSMAYLGFQSLSAFSICPMMLPCLPISTPSVGQIASSGCKTVGIHRTPEEFVQTAIEAGHPGLSHNMLPEPMREASTFCARHSEQFVARHRSEKFRQMIHRAKELSEQEESLKGSMSSRRRNVLENKHMLLFEELLVETRQNSRIPTWLRIFATGST